MITTERTQVREKVCKIDECEKGGKLTRGLCNAHYHVWRRETNPNRCSFEDCEKGVMGKGLCDGHYKQQRAGRELTPLREMPWEPGSTLAEKIKAAEAAAERMLRGCLIWPASRNEKGYGQVWCPEYGTMLAHRAAYLVHKGSLSKATVIHHTCGRGSEGCFEISHLQEVEHIQNLAEMRQRNFYTSSLAGLKSEVALLREFIYGLGYTDDDFDDFVDSITVSDLPEDLREELTD